MDWKKILVILLALFIIILFFTYWYLPNNAEDLEMEIKSFASLANSTFSEENATQFYHNMRFAYKNISYKIDEGCSLNKKEDMVWAFGIISQETILNFYSSNNGEIKVKCDDRAKSEEPGLFIAGEGGPVNVSIGEYFSVIEGGRILLIKESNCQRPNVAIHELLHVLGFDHTNNPNDILYPINKCEQTISKNLVLKINELYSYPSFPDLEIQQVNASISGRFLNFNISVKNEGLIDSEKFYLDVYADDKKVEEFELEQLKIGYGENLKVQNVFVGKLNFNKIKLIIRTDFEELNKENNEVVLEIKDN